MFFELFSYVEGLVNPSKIDNLNELAKDLANGSVVQVDADVDGELAVSENEFQADKDFGNPVEGDGVWKSFSSIGEEFGQGGGFQNYASARGATGRVIEQHNAQNNILKMADGGGVAEGWTDADLMAKGGGAWKSFSSIGEEFMQGGVLNRNVPNVATYSIGATVVEKHHNQNNILKMKNGGGVEIGDMAKLTDPDGFLFEQSFDNLKHAKRFADSFTPTIYRGLVRSDYEIIVVKEDEEYAVYYRLKNRPKTRMGKRVYAKGGGVDGGGLEYNGGGVEIGDMAKLTDPDGFLFEQSFDNLKHAKRFADSFTPTIYRGLVRSDYEIIVVKEDEEYAVYYRLKNRPKTRMGKRVYAKGGGVGEDLGSKTVTLEGSNKQYVLSSYSVDAIEDSYAGGEIGNIVSDWTIKDSKKFKTKQELIDYMNEVMYVSDYKVNDFDWESGEGKNVQTDVLCSKDEQGDFYPADDKEKALWKKGKKKLYNLHYFFYVLPVTLLDSYAKGGGVGEVFVISNSDDLKEFWEKNENADKTIFFVEEMDDEDESDTYYVVGQQTKKDYDDNQYWDYDGNYDTIKKATNAANKKAKKTSGGIYAINTSVINGYARGGKVHKTQQTGESNEAYDELTKSKGVGYRFTDKKAKRLGKKANAKPTQEEIEKFKGGKGVYFENRKNRSDVSRMKRLEKGGGVGEKFKAGDYVFAKASRFDTSIKDESAKIPFFVSHWSHDKYYVLGDGSHYISEGELTHATEKDFNDYYGENASEGYKHILEEGGEIGEYIVDGRITILGEDGSQRVRINETAFATSEDNAVDKVIAKYENIYGVDESEMEVDLYANKNYDKGGIVFDEKLKERLLSKKVINVGDKFLLPNMEITPSEFSDLIDKHLANRTKIGLYEYEVMGLYLNNMDGSERISLKWIGKHGKGYSSVDTYLDTFNTIRALLRYYDIMWKTHG